MKVTKENAQDSNKDILTLAAGFGLLTGLVEGIIILSMARTGLLTWRLYNRAIWFETLWIAPVVDLLLFSLMGLFIVLIKTTVWKSFDKRIVRFIFIFLCLFNWLFILLTEKISLVAILMVSAGLSLQLMYLAIKRDQKLLTWMQRSLPWIAALTAGLFLAIQGGGWITESARTASLPESRAGSPNILVIVVDTLRADHLSAYGYERETSPFIDSIASQGVIFTKAISTSSWTQPVHASLLTGHYTYEHQAELSPLDDRFPTIGEEFQSLGYRTGAFSANTLFFSRRQGFGRGFLHFEDSYQALTDYPLNTIYGYIFDHYILRRALNYEGTPGRRYAEDINRSMLDWVDRDTNKPFFIMLNYFDVHDPYTPPEPYRSKYARVDVPGGLINGYMERFSPALTSEQIQSEMDAYDGAINYVDDQIQILFDALQERNLLDNTLVIITSDHGEMFGEHGLLQHSASLYIQEIHVPLIFWGPGQITAGNSVDTPVTIAAIPATLLSFLEADGHPFPGPSLEPLMTGDTIPENWADPVAELAQLAGATEKNPSTHGSMKSVVGAEWQYIVHEKFGEELYNWQEDPQETENLVADPSKQSILLQFKQYLEKLIGIPTGANP